MNPENSTDLEAPANPDNSAARNAAQNLPDEESAIIPGRFWTLPVICLVTTSFVLGANEFIMMGILPDIAQGLHISQVLVGNLVSIFAAVYAVACPLVAAFSARFQRKTHLPGHGKRLPHRQRALWFRAQLRRSCSLSHDRCPRRRWLGCCGHDLRPSSR